MDNLIRERDFYRQQCNQLGARLSASIEAQARARREANRSRTTARLVRDIYRLADAEVSLAEIGQHYLQVILDAMRVDRIALLNYQPEHNRFVTWFSLGFSRTEPDFTPPILPAEFYFTNSTRPAPPELNWLYQAAGGPYLLWAFNPAAKLALLISNDTEDQHIFRPFEAADQEIVEGAISVLVDIIERKRAQVALQRANEVLERRVAERTAELVRANQQLLLELAERERTATRLQQVNDCFLSLQQDSRANINRLTELCGRLLGATCALYNRLGGGLLCSNGQWQTPPDYQPVGQPAGHICYDVIKSGARTPLVVRNLPDTAYFETDPNVRAYELQTYIGQAVKCGDKFVGSLCVVFQQDVSPSAEDQKLMGIIAAAIGLEEERDQAQQSLQQYQGHLEELVAARTTALIKTNQRLQLEIAERKRTEQALQQSEQQYRLLAENVNDVIWTTDLNFRFSYVSPSGEVLSGYTAKETLNLTIDQILTESSLAITAEVLANELSLEYGAEPVDRTRSVILELEEICKDGTIIPVEVRAGFLRDEAGQPVGILGITRDITERKQAEAALRESEQKYRQLVQYAPAGIYEVDFVRQRFTSVNDVMVEYTGYSREELLTMSPLDLLADESKVVFMQRLQQGLQGQSQPEDVEYKIKAKNGQEYWALLNARWRYQDNRPVGATVVVHNITDRKLIEEQIKTSLHEKQVLLQEIHHRVKNNLQIISSLLSLQSAHVQAPEVQHTFLDSQHRIRSMALIHEKLYRSENLAQIDFADYIRDLAAYLWQAHRATERGIGLNVRTEDILIKIDTAVPCGLILNELVSNALKHAFPQDRTGQIDIELKRENQSLCLAVSDNGVGLAPNFELNQTGSLGLQLVSTLVSQLNGTLEQSSNHGTHYRITFSIE